MSDDSDQHERRKYRRFTLGKPARLILTPTREEATGTLMDISLHGASLTTHWAVTAGVGVYLTFDYLGEFCEATGNVLRVFPFGDKYGLAVEFGVGNDEFEILLRALDDVPEASRPDIMDRIENLVVHIA